MNALFPSEVTVLSSVALGRYIESEYFPRDHIICRLFYRSIHDIYKITRNSSIYFYKVYRQGVRSIEEIQAEIALLHQLKESGVHAVSPVRKQDGGYIGQFPTENGVRYGVMFESVGIRDFDEVEETSDVNEKLGMYIASIHNAWDNCNIRMNRWEIDAPSFIDASMRAMRQFIQVHDFDISFLEDVAGKVKEKLKNLDRKNPCFGICHGDIYGGNIRVDAAHHPVLFDFDFCGYGWRAYDISMYAFPFGMGSDITKLEKREERKNQFLHGYNKVRSMSENEMKSIALFIPFRRIFNIGTLYISYLSDTWGDSAVIRNVDGDIQMLKKWLDLNPIL